jgi:hypothetical protein
MAEDFFTSVFPTLSSGKETKILISSTPNGYNLFHKFWVDAERGLNGFKHQRFDWWCHPDRDQAWADEQKAVLGELKYTQEVLMNFLGSSMTLFTGATLSSFSADTPMVQYGEGQYAGLKLYQKPVTDRKYVMTVDVSRGRHLDYSAFTVFDISDYPHKIVSVYKNNAIAPLQLAALVFEVSKKYNDAYILVEINDVGAQVAEELFYSYEVENMFWTKGGDTLGKKGSDPYPGIRTTTKTKRMGCANLKDIVEKQQLIINDLDMIQEAAVFIQSKTGSYQADEGAHDDLMMTLVLFAWMCTQSWFADLTDKSMRNQMYLDAAKRIEEDLCMDFYYDDGIQEPEAAGFGF